MFEKSQKAKVMDPQVKGMTYTELVSQELDAEMNRLTTKEKELTKGVNEGLESIKTQGNHTELARMVADLRKKLDKNAEEMKSARVKFAVDTNLKMMAAELDRADGTNKGMNLLFAIGPLINNILGMLPEIERCYGGDYFSPIAYAQIKGAMQGLAASLNLEFTKLHWVDKKALDQKIKDRMEVLRVSKMESQAITDKYKDL